MSSGWGSAPPSKSAGWRTMSSNSMYLPSSGSAQLLTSSRVTKDKLRAGFSGAALSGYFDLRMNQEGSGRGTDSILALPSWCWQTCFACVVQPIQGTDTDHPSILWIRILCRPEGELTALGRPLPVPPDGIQPGIGCGRRFCTAQRNISSSAVNLVLQPAVTTLPARSLGPVAFGWRAMSARVVRLGSYLDRTAMGPSLTRAEDPATRDGGRALRCSVVDGLAGAAHAGAALPLFASASGHTRSRRSFGCLVSPCSLPFCRLQRSLCYHAICASWR